MGKKNYINEITDAFGSKIDPKDALRLAKNIKSTQTLAYPSKKYKEKLFTKLENIYLVDQAGDIEPRFSLFQIFGVFTSFICIVGTMLIVLDFRQNTGVPVYKNIILEESFESKIEPTIQNEEGEFIPEAVVGKKVEDIIPQDTLPQEAILKEIGKDEGIYTPEIEVLQEILEIDDFRGEEPVENDSVFPSSSSMMMEDAGEIQIQETSFLDICSEFNGIVSEDKILCILSNGTICEEYNIYECGIQNTKIGGNENIEINLEELIEEYGQ